MHIIFCKFSNASFTHFFPDVSSSVKGSGKLAIATYSVAPLVEMLRISCKKPFQY